MAPAQPAVRANSAPSSPSTAGAAPARSSAASTPSQSGIRWVAMAAAWVLVGLVSVVWMNSKTHGGFGRGASASVGRFSDVVVNGGLNGTYTCADGATTMRITIRGDTGDMDLGVASAKGMRVERHGDTVSMSGGQAYDAQGQPVDAQTRAAISGGNDVDLLTVGDDGQSLSLDLGEGRRAKFVKQP